LHGSSDSDEEISDWVPETDQERRRNLQDTVGNDESLDGLKLRPGSSWLEFADEFNLPASRGTVTRPSTSKSDPVTIDIDSSETDDEDELPLFSCGMLKQSSGTPTSLGKNASASLSMNKGKRKVADQDNQQDHSVKRPKPVVSISRPTPTHSGPSTRIPKPSRKTFAKAEMEQRTKQFLGLSPSKGRGAQTLGSAPRGDGNLVPLALNKKEWSCAACTLWVSGLYWSTLTFLGLT
jgi:hypothetical protein